MSENVVTFKPELVGEAFRLEPDKILEAAKGRNFATLLIIGEIEGEDDLYVAGSANGGQSLILMELAKLQVIGK